MTLFNKLKNMKVYTRHFWHTLWLRKDEFHQSLELDLDYMLLLSTEDQGKYQNDLLISRNRAHDGDFK